MAIFYYSTSSNRVTAFLYEISTYFFPVDCLPTFPVFGRTILATMEVLDDALRRLLMADFRRYLDPHFGVSLSCFSGFEIASAIILLKGLVDYK
tara:strand:- start:252 stop:533 length:282 start_codon:yes stop_codon:yes gene_type:complete